MNISIELRKLRGESAGRPKLVLDFIAENISDSNLVILNLTAEIRVITSLTQYDMSKSCFAGYAALEPSGSSPFINKGAKDYWTFGLALDPYVLKKIEDERRKSRDLFFSARFFCTAARAQDGASPLTGLVQASVSRPSHGSAYCPFEVAQSEWIKILQALGYGSYFLMEIPLKGVPEKRGMQKALEHLKGAWEHFEQGHDDETLGSCYKAFEYLAKKGKFKHPDQNAFERILGTIPELEKRRRLKVLMHDLCQFLSLGRHEPGTEGANLDERESEYGLILSQATLGYLAKVMREAATK